MTVKLLSRMSLLRSLFSCCCQVFVDLGCGDGRICRAVAKRTGCRAVGEMSMTFLLHPWTFR